MRRTRALLLAAGLVAATSATLADDSARKVPEPQVLEQVTEDDNVRIEETRVRGQTKKLVVKPKIKGLDGYEIAAPEPGRAPADDPKAGQRVWWSLKF